MAVQRQLNLEEAKDWLGRLDLECQATTALRHLNINIELENFFRDLLKQIFGWSLTNANWSGTNNQDSFDLEDRRARLALQVTSTMTAAKIRKTLKTFIPSHRTAFDRLIFVYPRMSKTDSKADFSVDLSGFPFDPAKDRFDLSHILVQIQNLDIGQQGAALYLLRRELKPLGAALQMGVDPNVEAIISIIRYISDGAPPSGAFPELKPDAHLKLARFSEQAEFLKRQYTGNVGCYRAVAEAQQAAGYDTVRASRCAAWLRERSLSALEENDGDARKAFDALVDHLCLREREAGRDCEENAVRYFLADEFGKCNVFPNPPPLSL